MSRRSSSLSPPRRRYRKRSRSRSSSSDSSRSESQRRRSAIPKQKRLLGAIVVHDHRTHQDDLKSNDPALLACRVFIGNLPTDRMVKSDLEDWFKNYGKVIGCSLFRGYGFVQFENEESARKSVEEERAKGSLYKGFRLDVKMAAEGRRNTNSGPRRARSPPPRDAGFDAFKERSRDRSPLDDRRRDPYRRDVSYERALPDPRDDPYRRPPPPPLHPDDPYLRAPLPPRDPYRRDSFAPHDPYYRDALPPPPFDRPAGLPPAPAGPERPPYDCVIVLHNRQQMGYAEMVERRMKQNMMAVDIQALLENEAPQVLIDGATRRNIPFAAVINHQNEVHQSITINILHGTPQEHRNMPLDDAMTLVSRNFEQFVKKLCEKEVGPVAKAGVVPPDGQLTYLLNLLADGRHLTLEELDKVKGFVDQRRNRMLEAEGKLPNGGPMDNQRNNVPPPVNNRAPIRPGAPLSQQLQPVSGQKDEVAIIKQQAELQAKILSILNTSSAPAPVPPPSRGVNNMQSQAHMGSGHAETQSVASNNRTPTLSGLRNQMSNQQQSGPPPGQQFGGNQPQQNQRPGGSLPLNLDNPNIQKALDNLIQSGPSLIKSISNSQSIMSVGIQSAGGMQARPQEQQMMNRHRGPPPPHQNRMQRPPMQQQGMRMGGMQQQQQHQQQQQMMQAQQHAVMQMNMMQMGMRPRF